MNAKRQLASARHARASIAVLTRWVSAAVLGSVGASVFAQVSYVEEPVGGARRLPKVEKSDKRFTIRHWTVADGLPQQSITAIAQTPDRYIWCSTGDSIVRYDGREFRVFRCEEVPALTGFWIEELHCDEGGRLWIFDADWRVAVWAWRPVGLAPVFSQ